jgi:hypothetical protein
MRAQPCLGACYDLVELLGLWCAFELRLALSLLHPQDGVVRVGVDGLALYALLVEQGESVFFACRNIYSLIRLFLLLRSGRKEIFHSGIRLIIHNKEIAPFSWMKYIVISEADPQITGKTLVDDFQRWHPATDNAFLAADIIRADRGNAGFVGLGTARDPPQ